MIMFKARSVDISSTIHGRGNTCVSVTARLEEIDAEGLFYGLWIYYGDDWISELIKREGYLFSKQPRKE